MNAGRARPEVAVNRPLFRQRGIASPQNFLQQTKQFVQRSLPAERDVIDLVQRLRVADRCCQQVGLDDVLNEAEVAGGFAVAIDFDRVALQ